MDRRLIVTVALATLVVAGCTAGDGGGSAAPSPVVSGVDASSSAAPVSASVPAPPLTAAPVATRTPAPTIGPLPSDLDPEIRAAIEFRRSFGLRFDLEYVLAVHDDPAATNEEYGTRMYPAEFDQVLAAEALTNEIAPIVQAYGASHGDTSGGIYIDRDEYPGLVTALFTADLAEHEAALRERLGPDRPIRVLAVRYPYAELRRLQEDVVAAMRDPWVAAIPADIQGVGVDIRRNVLSIDVSSANPDAPAIIADHFGFGDRLRVDSDGTGAALIPRGTVAGTVLGPDGERVTGEAVGGLSLSWASDDPGDCGGGDIGYGVDRHGRFELPCQAGERTIIVDSERGELGRATVTVKPDRMAKLTIRLSEAP